jgi:hypothetical protein
MVYSKAIVAPVLAPALVSYRCTPSARRLSSDLAAWKPERWR